MAEATASAERADADDEPPALNALQENIARRGNNAYYYAHGHRNDAPAWDGDPSPMKLETTAAPPERRRCAITRYSWLDEDTKIRIYIPVDDERFQRPDAITLTWTEKSVVLAADLGDEVAAGLPSVRAALKQVNSHRRAHLFRPSLPENGPKR